MEFIQAFLITLIMCSGVYCVHKDIQSNIIPNKIIGITILLALSAQLLLGIFTASFSWQTWIVNSLLTCALAISMFFVDIWAPGDAKLFMALYLCVPANLIDDALFASVVTPYIFIFLLAMIWILFDTIFQSFKHKRKIAKHTELKEIAIQYCKVFVEATAFRATLFFFMPDFVIENELFCSTLMIVYSYICMSSRWMNGWSFFGVHLAVILVFWFFGIYSPSFGNWTSYIFVSGVLLFQRWASLYNYQEIETTAVKTGMILSSSTVLQFSASRINGLPLDASERLQSKLTKEQAESVKRWGKSAHGTPTILIVRKIPFALFIVIGFLTWIVFLRVG